MYACRARFRSRCGRGVHIRGQVAEVVSMARISVYLPDELVELVREQLPGVNVSRLVQETLAGRLACGHERVTCVRCTAAFDRSELDAVAVRAFWLEVSAAVEPIVWAVGTAEGAAAAAWGVARAQGLPVGTNPRPTRAEREAATERRWREGREAS
jgi:hypothetical protein